VNATALRYVVRGTDSSFTRRAVGVAAVLFLVSGGYVLTTEFTSLPTGAGPLYVLVLAAVVLAAASAYRRGGLVASWLVTLAPVGGALAAYAWVMGQEGPSPVALPGSFYGQGAGSFWVPTALLLGTLAFGCGVLARRLASGFAD
jgi:hypothetical protein